jgi:penicillin-binding protein 1C
VQERNKWLRKFAAEKVLQKRDRRRAGRASNGVKRHRSTLSSSSFLQIKNAGGDIVHTNIIMNTQVKTEKLVEDYVRALRLKNIKNAAVVVIDNKTHKVITYVGSSDFHDTTDGGQVNGAAAVREPGSTLKPLLYGLCIDEGLETPKMVVTDVSVNYAGYSPENYDKKFNGYVTVEYALEHSLNIPAVKSLGLLGKDKLIQKLASCDFTQIKKDQNKLGLSMILGGCGATLEELTGLFPLLLTTGSISLPPTPKMTQLLPGKRSSVQQQAI